MVLVEENVIKFDGAAEFSQVQRINKVEFSEVLRKFQYPGNIQQLFSELDDDGSGEPRADCWM